MRKGTFFFCVPAGLFISLKGCSRQEPGRYYNDKHDFSIKIPAGREINEGNWPHETPLIAISPWENDDDQYAEYIAVDAEKLWEPLTLREYVDQLNRNTEMEFAHYRELESGNVPLDNFMLG